MAKLPAFVEGNGKKISQYPIKTWLDFRLLAVDGSKIQLPTDRKLEAILGTLGKLGHDYKLTKK
jgi:hypothetical protein